MNVGQQVPEYKEPSLHTIGFHSQIILLNSSPLQKNAVFYNEQSIANGQSQKNSPAFIVSLKLIYYLCGSVFYSVFFFYNTQSNTNRPQALANID